MKKFHQFTDKRGNQGYRFLCPGCGLVHSFYYKSPTEEVPVWNVARNKANGEMTVKPSLRARWKQGEEQKPMICHSFITNGKILFLADSTHDNAGKTMEIKKTHDL